MLCRVRRLPLAQLPYLPPDPRRSINSLAAAFIESLQVRRVPLCLPRIRYTTAPSIDCNLKVSIRMLTLVTPGPCCAPNCCPCRPHRLRSAGQPALHAVHCAAHSQQPAALPLQLAILPAAHNGGSSGRRAGRHSRSSGSRSSV